MTAVNYAHALQDSALLNFFTLVNLFCFVFSFIMLCVLYYVFSDITFKDMFLSSVHRTLTPLPVQKYKDTVEAMREQLTSYCIQACYTCILQDAESHHWADPKPFYEVKSLYD